MTYPIIRIKALGDRRFEVLPVAEAPKGVGLCFGRDFECCFLREPSTCGDAFKICSEFPVIFKEILK